VRRLWPSESRPSPTITALRRGFFFFLASAIYRRVGPKGKCVNKVWLFRRTRAIRGCRVHARKVFIYICLPPPLEPSHPSHPSKNGIRIEVRAVTKPSQKGNTVRHKPSPGCCDAPRWIGKCGL
jgi:hypothetical protein